MAKIKELLKQFLKSLPAVGTLFATTVPMIKHNTDQWIERTAEKIIFPAVKKVNTIFVNATIKTLVVQSNTIILNILFFKLNMPAVFYIITIVPLLLGLAHTIYGQYNFAKQSFYQTIMNYLTLWQSKSAYYSQQASLLPQDFVTTKNLFFKKYVTLKIYAFILCIFDYEYNHKKNRTIITIYKLGSTFNLISPKDTLIQNIINKTINPCIQKILNYFLFFIGTWSLLAIGSFLCRILLHIPSHIILYALLCNVTLLPALLYANYKLRKFYFILAPILLKKEKTLSLID